MQLAGHTAYVANTSEITAARKASILMQREERHPIHWNETYLPG
jgi:hypothetical protein